MRVVQLTEEKHLKTKERICIYESKPRTWSRIKNCEKEKEKGENNRN